jgi:hypothetical protein
MLTDETGAFQFTELPPGRYTLAVSKTGFINLSYGQRRPLQAGTPLQLADGQQLKGIEFRLPRGSAITGRLLDEHGDPMPGAAVQAMRYQSAQGTRQLTSAGTAQTDDRGQYRIWGLNPGEYFVSADPNGGGRGGPGRELAGADSTGYAATFYPGVSSMSEARPITLTLGGEAIDVDFTVLLVRTARVGGSVRNSDGSLTWSGNVSLAPADQAEWGRAAGATYGARIGYDGEFTVVNVAPGRYTLRARSNMRDETPEFASLPVTVNGGALNYGLALQPGATISGMISLEGQIAAEANQFRISAVAVDPGELGSNGNIRAEKDGTFKLESVPEGRHWIRGQGPRGWTLKSVIFEGVDISDSPVATGFGQKISGMTVVFTNRLSEITGTVTNEQGQPLSEYTVLAFPTDSSLWRPASRHIVTTRPDQNGKFQVKGLPPGDYYLAIVDPSEPDEWFDPLFLDQRRAGAPRVQVVEGGTVTQDFKLH